MAGLLWNGGAVLEGVGWLSFSVIFSWGKAQDCRDLRDVVWCGSVQTDRAVPGLGHSLAWL